MPTSVLAAGHTWAPVDGRPVECRPCRLRYPVRQRGIRRCRLAGQDHKFRLAWVDPRRCVAPARGAGVNWRDVLRRAGIPLATRPRVGLLRPPPLAPRRPAPPVWTRAYPSSGPAAPAGFLRTRRSTITRSHSVHMAIMPTNVKNTSKWLGREHPISTSAQINQSFPLRGCGILKV